jgi:hypothetical protein
MKKTIIISVISLFFVLGEARMGFAQSNVTIDASQVVSTFKFTDSTGTQDKSYSPVYSGAYSLGYRYASEGGLLIRAGLGMRKAGATMVYDNINYTWNLQYADIKVGAGYIYNKASFQPYLSVSPYYAMLLKANQSLNNENFDIINSKSLQKNDYGVFITPGLQFKASDAISVYTEFNYMMGLRNLETDSGQKSYNRAYSFSLGVAFTITKK